MIWIVFGFLTALFEAAKDLCGKGALKKADHLTVVFGAMLLSIPVTLPGAIIEGIPPVDPAYFTALFGAAGMHVVANVLYLRAISVSPLSLTLPMISFTPIFMMLTAPFIIGEIPGIGGFGGVVLIVAGAYCLNIGERKHGFFRPFKALMYEKGARLMLLVSFIWSISGSIDRIGIRHSSPHFWLFSLITVITLMLLPVVGLRRAGSVFSGKGYFLMLLPVGVFNGLSMVFYTETILLTLISYAVSLKRFSILIAVLGSWFFFKEQNIKQRFLGAVIMLSGLVLISVAGR